MIILFQFEGCEHSAPVRQRLTALGLDFVAINAPAGYAEKDTVMEKLFGTNQTPCLWETQTGMLLAGEIPILKWLDETWT